MEKAFISIQKPSPIYFSFSEITAVTFTRVASNKSFEVKFSLTSGQEWVFSNINREEFPGLETFCKGKKLQVISEIDDGYNMQAAGDGRRGNTISSYQDDLDGSESEDEDFIAAKVWLLFDGIGWRQ